MDTIAELLVGNGLLIAIACLIIGSFIKGSTKIPNKYIPYINMIFAVLLGFVIPNTYTDKDVVSKIIILIFLGLSSVGLYETISEIVKSRFSIDIHKIFDDMLKDDDLDINPKEIDNIVDDETDYKNKNDDKDFYNTTR